MSTENEFRKGREVKVIEVREVNRPVGTKKLKVFRADGGKVFEVFEINGVPYIFAVEHTRGSDAVTLHAVGDPSEIGIELTPSGALVNNQKAVVKHEAVQSIKQYTFVIRSRKNNFAIGVYRVPFGVRDHFFVAVQTNNDPDHTYKELLGISLSLNSLLAEVSEKVNLPLNEYLMKYFELRAKGKETDRAVFILET